MAVVSVDLGDCDSCGYEGCSVRKFEARNYSTFETWDVWLCELCANTRTGNLKTTLPNPPDPGESASVLRTLCYIGNVLRAELRGVVNEVREVGDVGLRNRSRSSVGGDL